MTKVFNTKTLCDVCNKAYETTDRSDIANPSVQVVGLAYRPRYASQAGWIHVTRWDYETEYNYDICSLKCLETLPVMIKAAREE